MRDVDYILLPEDADSFADFMWRDGRGCDLTFIFKRREMTVVATLGEDNTIVSRKHFPAERVSSAPDQKVYIGMDSSEELADFVINVRFKSRDYHLGFKCTTSALRVLIMDGDLNTVDYITIPAE